jgi:hypothetical protein
MPPLQERAGYRCPALHALIEDLVARLPVVLATMKWFEADS